MKLREFLELLVPAGVLVSGKLVDRVNNDGKAYKAFSHATAKTFDTFANDLVRMDAEHRNAYFALAAYSQGFHDKPGEPGKKQLRVRTNVVALKALWFDIDFKGRYPDVKTAVVALKVFCQSIKLPPPSILVASGNGMHVYWPFASPVSLDRWQRLADALKAAALEQQLDIDPVCTADACRVLRPIGTSNWKDPANPKPVQLLGATGQVFSYEELEVPLLQYVGVKPVSVPITVDKSAYSELTGGLARNEIKSRFDIIIKHCGVSRHLASTHGKTALEPLWTAGLQLLKHCEDGEMWVHPISDGHPGYDPAETTKKWQQRLANTAGPTLCSTFEAHEPAICGKCPHRGFIKTPAQVGHEDSQPQLDGLPIGWRVAPDSKGVERLYVDTATNQKEWQKQMRHVPANLRITRSVLTGLFEFSLDIALMGSKKWTISLPMGHIGNPRKLNEALASYGITFKERETKAFIELMTTWIEKLQAARRIADVTEQLGWLIEKTDKGETLVGFAAGSTTFYTDGRAIAGVAPPRDFAPLAKLYEPKGSIEVWKRVADFLADQNLPAFTATLAAAFGTPLLRFTGLSGGILSLVSTASGVGKSSALKCSQAVWGSPTHGVNAVDDTPKSVARKLGFLNNLPAYWDELRGRQTVEGFLTLAFQITQGKERTRLDSSANMREVSTWETMLIVASNESIFEAMARHGGGSDAGVVRTFEIVIEPFKHDRNRAELAMMFGALDSNFGHAGKLYSQHLALNHQSVRDRVMDMFKRLAEIGKMAPQERFWFGIMTVLVVGAQLAGELGLVKINTKALLSFLLDNIDRLRGRSVDAMNIASPAEMLAAFMQMHQDKAVVVDRFPAPRSNLKTYLPEMTGGIPRADKMSYHVSRTEELMRTSKGEFERFLQARELPVYSIIKDFREKYGMRDLKGVLGAGTKWALPAQHLFEFDLKKFGLKPPISADPLSLV